MKNAKNDANIQDLIRKGDPFSLRTGRAGELITGKSNVDEFVSKVKARFEPGDNLEVYVLRDGEWSLLSKSTFGYISRSGSQFALNFVGFSKVVPFCEGSEVLFLKNGSYTGLYIPRENSEEEWVYLKKEP